MSRFGYPDMGIEYLAEVDGPHQGSPFHFDAAYKLHSPLDRETNFNNFIRWSLGVSDSLWAKPSDYKINGSPTSVSYSSLWYISPRAQTT